MLLNRHQREAVNCIEGAVLVLAGAGSGKTRVITQRIRHMLETGIAPASILALTFTNKAAAEMRQRLGVAGAEVNLGTFHSLGLGLIREFHQQLGLPQQIAILDQSAQNTLLRRVCKRLRTHLSSRPELLASLLSSARNEGLSAAALEASDDDDHHALGLMMTRYQAEKAALGAVDFDDLIELPAQMLAEHPAILATLQRRWRYGLVDEFQDTNTLQFALISRLMKASGNLCVVGDDDQSIYGWRGADQRNILEFEHHFPATTAILLTQNYRCKAPILRVANSLIAQNRRRRPKTLEATRGPGEPVRLQRFADNELEAEVIIQEIARLLRTGTAPNQIAILMRRSAQAPVFEAELARRSVAFRLVGGKRMADKKAARDLFAYMQVIGSDRNELAFRRAITTPSRGVGAVTIEKMRLIATQRGCGIAAVSSTELGDVRAQNRVAIDEFQASIKRARSRLDSGDPVVAVLNEMLAANQYRARLGEDISSAKAQARQSDDLDRTLEMLHSSWSDPKLGVRPGAKLNTFVNRLTLASGQDDGVERGDEVVLSTIHGAKGLEFDHVWVVGIEEGSLPVQRIIDDGDPGELEEERRLLYVAITRARDHLTLSYSEEIVRGERRSLRLPSRFLAELADAGLSEEVIGEAPRRDTVEVAQDRAALMARLAELGVALPERQG